MYKLTIAAVLGITCLLSNVAVAEQHYFGGSFAFIDYSEDGVSGDPSFNTLFGRLGTHLNENLSAEIRVGFGLDSHPLTIDGRDYDLELESMIGAYIRGGFKASDSLYPYAVLGYTRSQFTLSSSYFGLSVSVSESESDVSVGFGADVTLDNNLTLNAEYMSYFDKDGIELAGFSFGIASHF